MKLFFSLLILTLASCAHTPSKIDSQVTIGDSLNAGRYVDLYFSGQPTLDDIRELKKQGFASIINLRPASEFDAKAESKLAKELNLHYINVPFNSGDDLNDVLINKITKSVVSVRPQGKVLVHCKSGNRVGVWLAGHFYKDHKYSKKEALSTAKVLGLSSPGAVEKALLYLNNN